MVSNMMQYVALKKSNSEGLEASPHHSTITIQYSGPRGKLKRPAFDGNCRRPCCFRRCGKSGIGGGLTWQIEFNRVLVSILCCRHQKQMKSESIITVAATAAGRKRRRNWTMNTPSEPWKFRNVLHTHIHKARDRMVDWGVTEEFRAAAANTPWTFNHM